MMNYDQSASESNTKQRDDYSEDIGMMGIYVLNGIACLVGLWGISCLIAGLTNSGDLFHFCLGWISAVIG
ncbi:MAG: hypothetical protein KQH63_14870 [Desulfobulbaceae bacterium]|nr:hypothetical protein [Desulfobulbaceae bacterium]